MAAATDTARHEATPRARDPRNLGGGTAQDTGDRVLADAMAGAAGIRRMVPVGVTETRAAMRNRRGEPDGTVRLVTLTWDSVPPASGSKPLEVSGPADGRPIIIRVRSGCPTMRIASGRAVIVTAGSGYGIDVADGAQAVVIVEPDTKIGVTAETGSTVDFYPDKTSRGYQHIQDGATFRLHGRADDVRLSTDPAFAH